MLNKIARAARLTFMRLTGIISRESYRFSMTYPSVTVTCRNGATRTCNQASRVVQYRAQMS